MLELSTVIARPRSVQRDCSPAQARVRAKEKFRVTGCLTFRFGTPSRVSAPSSLEPHARGVPLILMFPVNLKMFFGYPKP
jgi:hypothetical protein